MVRRASSSPSPASRQRAPPALSAPVAAPSPAASRQRAPLATPAAGLPAWASLPWSSRITLIWLALDAFTHLTMEALYCALTLAYGGAAHAPSWLASASFMWREYGRADARWSSFDSTVLSLELVTVLLAGPLALAAFYGVWARAPWKNLALVILSTCELYGGWLTFAPEWLARPTSSPNLSGEPLHIYIYLFFFNFLWVLVPLILLYDAGKAIVRAEAAAAKGERRLMSPASGDAAYNVIAASLLLYVVLVPGVLLAAALR